MKGKIVEFRTANDKVLTGKVEDKILVLQQGAAASYHNYMVSDESGKMHVVNIFSILKILLGNLTPARLTKKEVDRRNAAGKRKLNKYNKRNQ